MRHSALLFAALLFTACGDRDKDGFSGKEDCDEGDPAIHTGASEICNGYDDNCDELTDDEDPALSEGNTLYEDLDGDGYGSANERIACTELDGWSNRPDDCDDADPEVHPSVPEACNGKDDDCNGLVDGDDPLVEGASTWYPDADLDTYGDADSPLVSCDQPAGAVSTGDDCDDADDTVFPGAQEICGDGVINNCRGSAAGALAYCLSDSLGDADAILSGENRYDYAGGSVAGLGDVNGDGIDDFLVGAARQDGLDPKSEKTDEAGASYLVLGPPSGDQALASSAARFIGPMAGSLAGYSVAGPGDVNQDGVPDLLIGGPYISDRAEYAGAAWLVSGDQTGDVDLGTVTSRVVGMSADDLLGYSVSGAGDVNGDGCPDVITGVPGNDAGASSGGAAALVLGPLTAEVSFYAADAWLLGTAIDDRAGSSVATAGDANGDGFDDLLVGAPGQDGGGNDSGSAYLVLGLVAGELRLADADAVLMGESEGDAAGTVVANAGDVNGDGYGDFLVGAPSRNGDGIDAGMAYLVQGPITGTLRLNEADASFAGESERHAAGTGASGNDIDGDGHTDILIGAPGADTLATDGGAAFLYMGPVTGDHDLTDADVILASDTAGAQAGTFVAGAGDADGDGYGDLLIAAPQASTLTVAGVGFVYFVSGAQW